MLCWLECIRILFFVGIVVGFCVYIVSPSVAWGCVGFLFWLECLRILFFCCWNCCGILCLHRFPKFDWDVLDVVLVGMYKEFAFLLLELLWGFVFLSFCSLV